jgi:cyanate permease
VKGLSVSVLSCSAIGPWITGAIFGATGSYDVAWMVLGGLMIPAALASLRLSEKRSSPGPEVVSSQ